MNFPGKILLVFAAAFVIGACTDTEKSDELIEVMYFGGDILSMEGDSPQYVEAIGTRDGKIVFVGSRADADSLIGNATQIHDLNGHTLLPGFIDAHGHIFNAGFQNVAANLLPPPDGEGSTIAGLIDIMNTWADENRDVVSSVGWIFGFGYDDAQLDERRHPTADELDEISTELPVIMVHQSAHIVTVNHKALEMIGYKADTADPPGGVIRREDDGMTPDGVLEESAKLPAQIALFSQFDNAANEAIARSGIDAYTRNGFTTAQEGKASGGNIRSWQALADQGGLPIDIAVLPDIVSEQTFLETANFSPTYKKHLRIAGVKLTLDGSPQGYTAWLTEPYTRPREGQQADYRGYAAIADQGDVNQLVLQAFMNDWQLYVHCNGDAAADQLLNAIEYATDELGPADRRPVMVHAQTVRFDQLERMKEYGVMPSFFSLHTYYWGDWHAERTLGRERAFRISPTATALGLGMRFTEHHDAPVVSPNSMMVLHTTVNRESRSGEVIGPEERVSPYVALLSITRWAAYQYFEEDRKGSLKVGKLADLVILESNPLKVDAKAIKDIGVVETIKEGKTVYRAESGETANFGTPSTADAYLTTDVIIQHPAASNHVRVYMQEGSNGEFITILPSLGRGVEDYTEQYESTITTRLVEAGYRVILIQPRGIGESAGDLTAEDVDMSMLADDIKATLDAMGIGNLHVAGHAFGNRLARTFATKYPNYVDNVILLASGGNFEMEPEAQHCLEGSINLSLPDRERLALIHCAFFADGNDASSWLEGWYPGLAAAQINAARTIDTDFYKAAGGKDILLIQAAEDYIAPPELAGKALAAELGDQVTYVEVPNAGHALTSEQPDLVAGHIVEYLRGSSRADMAPR